MQNPAGQLESVRANPEPACSHWEHPAGSCGQHLASS